MSDNSQTMKRLLLISNSTSHGSGYLDHCEAQIVEFLGKGVESVLFIPFALHDQQAYGDKATARFSAMGYRCEVLRPERHAATEAISHAQSIFVGGGNTFRLLRTLQQLDLLDAIRQRVQAGMPYFGASAGSNIACPTIQTTNDMPIVEPPSFEALNLVSFAINAHYLDPDPTSTHKGETRQQRIEEFLEENDRVVVGLREGAMLRIEGDVIQLQGVRGTRVFQRGEDPKEYAPSADPLVI
jgi:dipeptidase E